MTDLDRLQDALGEHYAIERALGRGGTSVVFLARDLHRGSRVALKVLRPEIASVVGKERFLREIRLATRLRHPYIVGLIEAAEAEEFLYFSMPFVEGESLRERLGREPQLAATEAVQITCEVAEALAYAHGEGVVHRDIKPENLLLSSGQVFVTDFGLGKALDAAGSTALTASGLALGTPAYISPEQAARDGHLDGRSDLYSLGVVLYEMLAGVQPFVAATRQQVVAMRFVEPPPPLTAIRDDIPETLVAVVSRMLAVSPADRFGTARDLIVALRGLSPATPRARDSPSQAALS
jgi:eukaryotic-like serine/threonine-protein kinase